MKKVGWCAAGLMAILVAVSPAAKGQEGETTQKTEKVKKKPAKPKTLIRGHYAIMAKHLEFTDEQKAALEEKLKARKAAEEEWKKQNAAKLDALSKAYAEAKKAEKKDEAQKLRKEIGELRSGLKKIQTSSQKEILGILTNEQKAKWEVYQFSDRYVRRYGKAKLTDAQKAKMREICAAAKKQMDATKDRKAGKAIEDKLKADLEAVLTDEQREKMKATKKPPKEKPAAKPQRPKDESKSP
jgi:Spy/CpxP family protein refolding chaperone